MEETISDVFVIALQANEDLMVFLKDADTEEDRIYAASSLGQGEMEGGNPSAPDFPYLVWNELPSTVHRVVEEVANSQHRYFTFHVTDEAGSLTRINAIIRQVRATIKGMPAFETTDEGRCIEVRWVNLSGPVADPSYNAVTRFGTARFQVSE